MRLLNDNTPVRRNYTNKIIDEMRANRDIAPILLKHNIISESELYSNNFKFVSESPIYCEKPRGYILRGDYHRNLSCLKSEYLMDGEILMILPVRYTHSTTGNGLTIWISNEEQYNNLLLFMEDYNKPYTTLKRWDMRRLKRKLDKIAPTKPEVIKKRKI